MLKDNREQREAVSRITKIVGMMEEVEKLQAVKYGAGLNADNPAMQAVAGMELNNYPSYRSLEGDLRGAVEEAIALGLGDDPIVRLYSKFVGIC